MKPISANLFQFQDTCHVYVIRSGDSAVLVDFGDGGVLEELADVGVQRVTDILITHHHRDQAQGLGRALASGCASLSAARVWVPHTERAMFDGLEAYWQSRPLLNNYNVRQDRFSLLKSIPVHGTLKDYTVFSLGGYSWRILPAPGHTPGSLALMAEIDGARVVFCGDLIAEPGKVWSLAALQWSYQRMEGAAAMIPVLLDLQQFQPDLLLPSHGSVMEDPQPAMDLLVQRLRRMLDARMENPRMMEWLREPYEVLSPHLLRNRTSVANSYVLLSGSGKALFIDYGYDFVTSNNSGPEPALHRPWLYTLPTLKRDYGVQAIDVVIPTHYHDDHVAGMNLLRATEGTQVWAAKNFAAILAQPDHYDLPCLWYDPVPVDRVLPLDQPISWEEYSLVIYALPGHTRYASAIAFTVDGLRVLATGDQYRGPEGTDWNYVYQNRFSVEDYRASAALYARLAPDIILPGHWDPLWTSPEYFQCLREKAETLVLLHQDLLSQETVSLGAEGFAARIWPYHYQGKGGEPIHYCVEVRNPLQEEGRLRVRLVLPQGWQAQEAEKEVQVAPGARGEVFFVVLPSSDASGQRFRLAVDITANELHLGQQAEALVDLLPFDAKEEDRSVAIDSVSADQRGAIDSSLKMLEQQMQLGISSDKNL